MTLAPLAPVWFVAAMAALGVLLALGGVIRRRHGGLRWARRGVLVLLVAAAGANPVVGERSVDTGSRNIDIVFAVDTTTSSAAEDYRGEQPRIEGMRDDMREIVAAYPGARFGIVGFDRTTNLLLPLSEDADAAGAAIDVLRPEISVYADGSRIDAAVDVLRDVLEREEESGRARVLVYLGDGESTLAASNPDRFGSLAPLLDGGAVFGYGSREGGAMRETSGASLEPGRYLREGGDGERVLSRIDEGALRSIAGALEVPYAHRVDDGAASGLVDVSRGAVGDDGIRVSTNVEQGSYWMFAIPVGVLLLVELALLVAPIRTARALPGRSR